MSDLNDSELQTIKYLAKNGITGRSAVATFLFNCRLIRFQLHLNDQQYHDTLRQSAKNYLTMYKEISDELTRLRV